MDTEREKWISAMKVKAKVLAVLKDEKGKLLAKLQFNQKLPRVGDMVTVKWGKVRSILQNALYWTFLQFLLDDCNLKEEYLDKEELHETLKGRFLAKKVMSKGGFKIIVVGSTTDLDKHEFAEYLEKVDKVVIEYHHVDTSEFWKDYEKYYAKH